MASVLAKICQVSVLLHTANKSPSIFLVKTLTVILSPLLSVSFPDLKLSNVTELSESDLPIATSTNLDILIEAFDFSILLLLELSIPTFSSLTYIFSLSSEPFFS